MFAFKVIPEAGCVRVEIEPEAIVVVFGVNVWGCVVVDGEPLSESVLIHIWMVGWLIQLVPYICHFVVEGSHRAETLRVLYADRVELREKVPLRSGEVVSLLFEGLVG